MEDLQRKYDITVLMGGPSKERDISLLSGSAIAAGLEEKGHHVTRADITPQDTSALDRKGIDVVFIALHGDFGESGEVQELCQKKGLPYTGSGPKASRLGMDKAASKQIFKRDGITTPDWMVIENFHTPEEISSWLKEITPPVVVKPIDGGSSQDVYICHDEKSRNKAIDELVDFYGRTMVERFVPGREFTVGILGEQTLPVLEIIPADPFYDYNAKYADNAGTQYIFDHGLDKKIVDRIEAIALKAHQAIGCRALSRVDFILDEHGTPQILELNTIPGFTSHSLVPMAAKRAGIDFSELVDKIVRLAVSAETCLCSRD